MRSVKYLLAAIVLALLVIITSLYRQSNSVQSAFQYLRRPFILTSTTTSSHHHDPNEKFLTFYPHSGLHNQRLGLLNAMVLAKALNRTLVLPQINLGRGTHWAASPKLAVRMAECPDLPIPERRGGGCADYRRYIPVPVSTVFDLSVLDAVGIPYIERDDMHLSYFHNELGVYGDDDMYQVNDSSRFSYRIYGTRNTTTGDLRQFEYRLDLEDLAMRPERALVFGSLFGSTRLVLDQRPDLSWLLHYLSGELGFGHPTVVQQTLNVVSQLGGPGEFVGVHLRTGDGVFRVVMEQTMNMVRQTLQGLSPNNPNHVEQQQQQQLDSIEHLQSLGQQNEIQELLHECVSLQHNRHEHDLHHRLRLIFMATDAAQPRQTLPSLYNEFVCLFSLSDFDDAIQQTITSSSNDNLGPLLLPLLDAEVASHGEFFVGTKRSTFSKYIEYRNHRFLSYYPNHPTLSL
ncbi:hypothetical protein RO3G_10970 [Lichtheimia corymbifera JMRC:FSU:9682]|uniref:Uncharacterized protein n=1 Tax=Lichtheimia corymbifera JMRC:FSU:9682 TaxID=1263082 RepID=A0A068SHB7_9FUNG|nr:hypothetical protein RO3G_10970 [Lichtheimia corymbifera JMRC:FSU:9682]CDH61303.1 hypothetical protein RO3G_10970 [Lichtheimia corymbifera JMRC:FSU:9682]